MCSEQLHNMIRFITSQKVELEAMSSFPTSMSFLFFLLFPLPSTASECSHGFYTQANKFITPQACNMKTLGTEFAWNFDNRTRDLDIVFGSKLRSGPGWLAWGLNPLGRHMIGTAALIGIKQENGSLELHKYSITSDTKRGCRLLPVEDNGLGVSRFGFGYVEEIGYYLIHARVLLSREINASGTNMIWQVGAAAETAEPLMHGKSLDNFDSSETVDLVAHRVLEYSNDYHRNLRTAHGILNLIGWGTFVPLGVMVSRYLRIFPRPWKHWFFLHVSFQLAGYTIGSIGWGLGIWLGMSSKYYSFNTHKILGDIIFTFTTIQICALIARPNQVDSWRKYWNMYHHLLGYSLLVLISVNIFKGIQIIGGGHAWKWAYIAIAGSLGGLALALEVFTWIKYVVMTRK